MFNDSSVEVCKYDLHTSVFHRGIGYLGMQNPPLLILLTLFCIMQGFVFSMDCNGGGVIEFWFTLHYYS